MKLETNMRRANSRRRFLAAAAGAAATLWIGPRAIGGEPGKNPPSEKLNIADVLKCWRHGSVIRSWLIDLMEAQYRKEGGLEKIPYYVEDTGEVNWLVSDALRMEVSIPVISQAVMQLFTSRDDKKNWARAIAMMRNGFGGHAYGPSEPIKQERREGRVGDFVME